jgi:hypothetical protein
VDVFFMEDDFDCAIVFFVGGFAVALMEISRCALWVHGPVYLLSFW